ncbi:uncharacterized protein MELLADRAFT_116559 [Melampsora larici-populina 98AG31]|uniref:UBA domain-containing protein n=1 Tax=Melampsora larici-populina (strain 98AG31 / pathotype 3-4-7) TaxID=747676 RepID=F4RMN2_MELLP|nr:uncharacterized protein MELLADRAFT_116559 [Melampsora larici-populina 98AG31]EGG06142.1 hypothetical protein MELLADRAFT_116559 [Melampsora larici-populina 98AG31]
MDDLVDLTFATSNSNLTSKPQSTPRNGSSSFDYLSATIARPSIITPGRTNSSYGTKPNPIHESRSAGAPPTSDAFSSLFGANDNASQRTGNSASSMTISERLKAAELEKQKQKPLEVPSSYVPKSLDPSPIMGASFAVPSSSRQTNAPSNSSLLQVQTPPSTQPHSGLSADTWDFDFLESTSGRASRVPSPVPTNLTGASLPLSSSSKSRKNSWDIDFDQPNSNHLTPGDIVETDLSSSTSSLRPGPTTHNSSISLLGDEFGPLESDQERHGQISLESGGDDILGLLGAPVVAIDPERIKRDAAQLLGHKQQTKGPSQRTRSNSPPPHILGQVVEMGFTIPQARQSLNQTFHAETGEWDVSAAVEKLLASQGETAVGGTSQRSRSEIANHERSSPSSRPPQSRRKEETRPNESPSSLVNAKEIQDQAADLLAQASAYGSTAFGKAASFWKQSKASITKVIEDQTASSSGSSQTMDGGMIKPKWMKDDQQLSEQEHNTSDVSRSNAFSDDLGPSYSNTNRSVPTSRQPSPGEQRPSQSRQPYVSSARRKVAERNVKKPTAERTFSSPDLRNTPDSFASLASDLQPSLPSVQVSNNHKLTPTYNFPSIPIINLDQSQITTSLTHRNKGNEWFKQGQYSNAESSYTKALETLQGAVMGEAGKDAYLGCLPVLNNRAAARLKNGDGKGAREDANRVIEILLCEDSEMKKSSEYLMKRMESNLNRIPNELKGSMDINEQLGKALSKRAKIKEDFEKWEEAKVDWEFCRNLGGSVTKGAGGMKMVAEGLARCMKANQSGAQNVGVRSSQTSRPITAQKPITRTRPVVVNNPNTFTALQKLREANEQAESESNQMFQSKDLVDAKIENWKSGKETNLRALLASLDQVLWSSLNWKKIGMGELLTESQVKVKYVRAISKVHPDKIPKDATVEEQMIGKAVFAVLNEAWIAMQG